MKRNRPNSIQFISLPYPGDHISTKVQRKVHSHAARVAHAKARRQCVAEYQAGKSKRTPEISQAAIDRGLKPSGSAQSTLDIIDTGMQALPSPISLLPSDRRDPFDSFVRTFEPIEHFLLDHYVKAVLPFMSIKCNKFKKSNSFMDLMTREWVQFTLGDLGSLSGIFLSACRHLLETQQQQQFNQLAIRYKVFCARALRESIRSETPALISDSTVALGILLAYDEAQVGDLSMFKNHSVGLIQMVEHNGGPQTLGLDGFLERLVSKLNGCGDVVCKFQLKPW